MKTRVEALDALRGIAVAAMILVNNPGSWSHIYAPLRHAQWHGFTPTDFIFPLFLFCVGAAMAFSMRAMAAMDGADFYKKVLKRTALIFVVGLLLNALPFNESLSELRIPGVLQRIALCYCMAAVALRYLNFFNRIILIAVTLVIYWIILCSFGDLSLENNIVRSIDLTFIGAEHMWAINNVAFDPEGILSAFPAVVNVLIGFETAQYLRERGADNSVYRLLVAGIGLVLIAIAWHWFFPINKSLWTSSFVVLSSGVSIVLLASLVWCIDIKGSKRFSDFWSVYGSNALFVYVVSWVWAVALHQIMLPFAAEPTSLHQFLYQVFSNLTSPINGSLIFALTHVILFWLLSLVLFKKKILIKL